MRRERFGQAQSPVTVILDDGIECPKPVAPADLFSLGVCPAVVGDSYLINPRARPGNLCDKFRFNSEPVFLDCNTVQKFASKNFVTALHIA